MVNNQLQTEFESISTIINQSEKKWWQFWKKVNPINIDDIQQKSLNLHLKIKQNTMNIQSEKEQTITELKKLTDYLNNTEQHDINNILDFTNVNHVIVKTNNNVIPFSKKTVDWDNLKQHQIILQQKIQSFDILLENNQKIEESLKDIAIKYSFAHFMYQTASNLTNINKKV